jgi:hypothetical protein
MNNSPNSYHRRRCKGPRLCYILVARASSCQHLPDLLQGYESKYISLEVHRDQRGSWSLWVRVTCKAQSDYIMWTDSSHWHKGSLFFGGEGRLLSSDPIKEERMLPPVKALSGVVRGEVVGSGRCGMAGGWRADHGMSPVLYGWKRRLGNVQTSQYFPKKEIISTKLNNITVTGPQSRRTQDHTIRRRQETTKGRVRKRHSFFVFSVFFFQVLLLTIFVIWYTLDSESTTTTRRTTTMTQHDDDARPRGPWKENVSSFLNIPTHIILYTVDYHYDEYYDTDDTTWQRPGSRRRRGQGQEKFQET